VVRCLALHPVKPSASAPTHPSAARRRGGRGMKVTLINDDEKPGGTCLHVGCIPSKALLHAATLITDTREGPA
jgi:dihydrolipoyl dehydrogenase